MNEDAKRLFDKVTLNCFYTPSYNPYFFSFDTSIAKEITEEGRKLLNNLRMNTTTK